MSARPSTSSVSRANPLSIRVSTTSSSDCPFGGSEDPPLHDWTGAGLVLRRRRRGSAPIVRGTGARVPASRTRVIETHEAVGRPRTCQRDAAPHRGEAWCPLSNGLPEIVLTRSTDEERTVVKNVGRL